MSLIKANAVQIGQSNDATENFTLAVPSSPDGTIKLARGNAGATTQDVLNVSNAGVVSFPQGLGNISNSTAIATGSTTARSLANRFADVVNVKDFGAVGDGVARPLSSVYSTLAQAQAVYPFVTSLTQELDWAAIQAAINYVKSNGGVLTVPSGTYITSPLNVGGGVKAWEMVGAGQRATYFQHKDGNGTLLFGLASTYGFKLQGFTVNCMYAEYSNLSANHGISIEDTSRIRIKEVTVRNYKNSAIILASSSPGTHKYCLMEDCEALGLNASANGLLMDGMWESGYVRCTALGSINSPGYGIQFKNDCRYCYMTDCYSEGNRAGFAFGQDTGDGVNNTTCTNLRAYNNTVYGFVVGYATNNKISNLYVDCNSNLGSNAIELTASSNNSFEITAINIASSRSVVAFTGAAAPTDNYIHVTYAANLNSSAYIADFGTLGERNTCILERSYNPQLPSSGRIFDFCNWPSEITSNKFDYKAYSPTERVYVASGVIKIKNSSSSYVSVDTEGVVAADDLDTINGDLFDGRIILISTLADARDITVKNNTGNILLANGVDRILAHSSRTLTLRYSSGISKWVETAYSAPI